MPLVKNGKIAPDTFTMVSDDEAVPDAGAVFVTAARLFADPALANRRASLGVVWPNNRDIHEIEPFLDRLDAVALVFPSFRDGRAYSQARLLRERFKFRKELRATGQVLRDQFVFMLRAGFDVFDVVKTADAEAFATTARRYSVFYQPTGESRITALHRRMQLRHAEESDHR